MSAPVETKRKRHTLADIYHERTHFEFIARSWRWAILSGVLLAVSLLALVVWGLNLGIDFEGGTAIQVTVVGDTPSVGDVRDAVEPFGLADAKISIREDRDTGNDIIVIQTEDLPSGEGQLNRALEEFGSIDSFNEVGPTWGDQVTEKALRALLVFFALIAIYLSFRLEWKMAASALIAMIHDIIITAGVYAITGFEVTPATVVAFLTILGFSLYDTVVVFDKIRENTHTIGSVRGDTYSTMVNRSLNQVLIRSLNTSFVALLPVGSLLVVGSWLLGAVTLRDFALALFVGLLTGAYSSIFVATPIVAWWKEREPRYRAVRERAAVDLARTARAPAAATVAAPVVSRDPDADAPTSVAVAEEDEEAAAPETPVRAQPPPRRRPPPRGRQQRGRKRK